VSVSVTFVFFQYLVTSLSFFIPRAVFEKISDFRVERHVKLGLYLVCTDDRYETWYVYHAT
jgi:hypothetical protein